MRTHRIASRPHVQGSTRSLCLTHNAQGLTDGAGLLLLRQLWDRLHLGGRIDARTGALDRRYRSSRFIEGWLGVLLYGGGVLDDLHRLAARDIYMLSTSRLIVSARGGRVTEFMKAGSRQG